jgi:hypothetical protein
MEEQGEARGYAADFGDQHFRARRCAEQLRGEARFVCHCFVREFLLLGQFADEGEGQACIRLYGCPDTDIVVVVVFDDGCRLCTLLMIRLR